MLIYHVALVSDWREAQTAGEYAVSTIGRTLAEEGFIHAARADQVDGVTARYYADVSEPLVRLTVDTDLLAADVRHDRVGDDTFPHVYGPIEVAAVVAVQPWPIDPA